ncbi:MAG: TVP38/TMEM64 family protein [Ponticaulis sp.]|nr:TVP38/TMEM64 family protein [Ponticaulis sp.]|tara:strand:- start:34592 stop:35368 length:777 start_codon:yes stop_codon:yes gene_type:complete
MSTDQTSETKPDRKTNWWLRLLPVALIIGVLLTVYLTGAHKVLSLETLKDQRESLNAYVAENLLLAVGAYLLVYALATIFMLPGALWITLTGGFLFGLVGGSVATVFAATIGATTLFTIARTSIGQPLRQRAGPFLKRLEAGFSENALSYMFFLRFMPAVPFPVANIAPALLGAKPREFVISTFFGIMPGVIAYTWLGAGLGGIFDRGEELNLSGLFTQIAPPMIALALVSLLPVAIKALRKKKAGPDSPAPLPPTES